MNGELCKKNLRQIGYTLLLFFVLSKIFDGLLGGCFEFATVFLWEGWYGCLFLCIKLKDPKYFNDMKIRFIGSLVFVCFIEYCFLGCRMVEWGADLSSEDIRIFEIVHIVRYCIYLVFFIWQISMLKSAIAVIMSPEEYERKRGKILFSLLLAPIGVIIMRDDIKASENTSDI